MTATEATDGCWLMRFPAPPNSPTGHRLPEQIGGKPDAESERTVVPGTCFDYVLSKAGSRQPYSVSFDGNGKVDKTAFMTCAEWSNAQHKARLPSMGGSSGSGY
ncbi:hypothetical protein STW0522PSE72_19930 [Pseudomonas monteilii]|nr:hypothetical protein STW0522PSE72_19930 [Pseudomonas monteilii]